MQLVKKVEKVEKKLVSQPDKTSSETPLGPEKAQP